MVGIDIEKYDSLQPEKYFHGLLQNRTNKTIHDAFQSYIGIMPSSAIHFDEFAKQVSINVLTFFLLLFKNLKKRIR